MYPRNTPGSLPYSSNITSALVQCQLSCTTVGVASYHRDDLGTFLFRKYCLCSLDIPGGLDHSLHWSACTPTDTNLQVGHYLVVTTISTSLPTVFQFRAVLVVANFESK